MLSLKELTDPPKGPEAPQELLTEYCTLILEENKRRLEPATCVIVKGSGQASAAYKYRLAQLLRCRAKALSD